MCGMKMSLNFTIVSLDNKFYDVLNEQLKYETFFQEIFLTKIQNITNLLKAQLYYKYNFC